MISSRKQGMTMGKLSYKLSQEQIDNMAALHKAGVTCPEIAQQFGVSKPTVYYHLGKNTKESYWGNSRRWSLKSSWVKFKQKAKVIQLLGGKCVRCGVDDYRVLQVNHRQGRGREERAPQSLYRDIVMGRRTTDDLELRCANCNILYEYEHGRRRDWTKDQGLSESGGS